MEITEVRIKLMDDPDDRLRAFCSITFDDCFVIRDLKIIEGTSGPFVAMPSRKLTTHCHQCGCKNHLRAAYCNQCGAKQSDDQVVKDEDGRAKLYADIAHPINSACREMIQQRVIEEYDLELERAKEPGYRSSYDDFYGEDELPRVAASSKSARNSSSRPTGQQNRIEPAAAKNQGPHRTSGSRTANSRAASRESRHPQSDDGFGAGIF